MVWRKLPNAILKQKHSVGQYKTLLRNQIRSFTSTNNNNGNNGNNGNKENEEDEESSLNNNNNNNSNNNNTQTPNDSIQNALKMQKMKRMSEQMEKVKNINKSNEQKEQREKEEYEVICEEDLLNEDDIKEIEVAKEHRKIMKTFVNQVFETKPIERVNASNDNIATPTVEISEEDQKLVKELLNNYSKNVNKQQRIYIARENLTDYGLIEKDYNEEYPPYINKSTGAVVSYDYSLNAYKYQASAISRSNLFSKVNTLKSRIQSDEMVLLLEYLESSPENVKDRITGDQELFKFAMQRIKFHQRLLLEKNRYSAPPAISITKERDLASKVLAESGLIPEEVIAEVSSPFVNTKPKELEFGLFENSTSFKLKSKVQSEEIELNELEEDVDVNYKSLPIDTLYDQYIASEQYYKQGDVDPVPSDLEFNGREQYLREQLRQYYYELQQREQPLKSTDSNEVNYKPIPEGYEKYDGPIESANARDAPTFTFDPEFMRDFVHYKALALPHENLRVQEFLDDAENDVDYDLRKDSKIEQEEVKAYIKDYFDVADDHFDVKPQQPQSQQPKSQPQQQQQQQNIKSNKSSNNTTSSSSSSFAGAFAGSTASSQSQSSSQQQQQKQEQQEQKQQQSQDNERENVEEEEEKLEKEEEKEEEEEEDDGEVGAGEEYDMSELDETNQDADLFLDSDDTDESGDELTDATNLDDIDNDEDEDEDEDIFTTATDDEDDTDNDVTEDVEREVENELQGNDEDEQIDEDEDEQIDEDVFSQDDNEQDQDNNEGLANGDEDEDDEDEEDFDEEDEDESEMVKTFADDELKSSIDENDVSLLDEKDPLFNGRLEDLGVTGPVQLDEDNEYLSKGDIQFLEDMSLLTDSLFLTMDSEDSQYNGDEDKTDSEEDAITFGGIEDDDEFTLGGQDDFKKDSDYNVVPARFDLDEIDKEFSVDRSGMTKEQVIKSIMDEYAIADLDQDEKDLLDELEKELSPKQYRELLIELKEIDASNNKDTTVVDKKLESFDKSQQFNNVDQVDDFTESEESFNSQTGSGDGEELLDTYDRDLAALRGDEEEYDDEDGDEEYLEDGRFDDNQIGFRVKSNGFNITHPNGIQQLENLFEEMELLDIMQGTYEEDMDLLRAEADMYAKRSLKKIKLLAKKRDFARQMKVKQMEANKLNPPVKQPYSIGLARPIGHNVYTNVLAPPNSYLRLHTKQESSNQNRNKKIIEESYRALSSNPFYGVKEANFAVKKINKELLASEGNKKFRQHQLKNTKPVPNPLLSKPSMLVEPDKLHEFNSFYREN